MEKLSQYAQAIVNVLQQHVHQLSQNEIEEHLLTDYEHGHFQLLRTGWADKDTFRMGILLHFQLKTDGKIWILANWTEDDVAKALVEQGVDKSDIVLGFQPKSIRPYSGYAVA
jgi:XisI protein